MTTTLTRAPEPILAEGLRKFFDAWFGPQYRTTFEVVDIVKLQTGRRFADASVSARWRDLTQALKGQPFRCEKRQVPGQRYDEYRIVRIAEPKQMELPV